MLFLKLMASTPLKLAAASVVTAGLVTTLVVQHQQNVRLRADLAALREQTEARPPKRPDADPAPNAPSAELLRLRGEVARLLAQQKELADLQAENARLRASAGGPARPAKITGEEFLAANAAKKGVHQTASGLQYKVLNAGTGRTPAASDTVNVHYHGTLTDGTVFDSSVDRGEPIDLPVGAVIPGWKEALQMMKEGSRWQIFIPSKLAYGERGAGDKIGPDSTLIFDLELLGIEPKKEN
jgi:FKBP-type peptidyl-prolyl cis-trans isomerase FklB